MRDGSPSLEQITAEHPVLIAHTDPYVRNLLSCVLEMEHIRAICEPRADAALALCKAQPVSMLISNLWRSDPPDGIDLLARVRKNPATAALPFMFLTAITRKKIADKAGDLAFDSYVQSPFDPEEVLAEIKRLLAQTIPHALPALTAAHPVLLCDDSEEMVTLEHYILAGRDLTAIACLRAQNALEWCRKVPVSLILSDISKPDMDGFEMLARLKADPATRAIPLAFLTARCSQEDEERALQLGAVAFYNKPLLPAEIIERVERALRQHGNWRMPAAFDPQAMEQAQVLHQAAVEQVRKRFNRAASTASKSPPDA